MPQTGGFFYALQSRRIRSFSCGTHCCCFSATVSPPAPPSGIHASQWKKGGKKELESDCMRGRHIMHVPTYLLPTATDDDQLRCYLHKSSACVYNVTPPSFQLPPLFFHPCLLGFLLQYFQCVTAPKCIRVEKGGREKNCLLCKTEKRRRSCPLSTLFFCYIFRIIERGGCAF